MHGRLLCFALFAILVPLPVAAGDPAVAAPRDCQAEIAALCADTAPRSAERLACVRERKGELSEPCRERLVRARSQLTAGLEALRQSCGQEIDRHCDDVSRRHGGLLRCLDGLPAEQVSDRCGDYLEILRAMRSRRAQD